MIAGEKRVLNKRIVEKLAGILYPLELENASPSRIWAYRKAAWAIEDLEPDVGLVYRSTGLKGLESIPNLNPMIAKEIEGFLESM